MSDVRMDPHCKGCAYLGYAGSGMMCCDYIFKEGRRRPCPPGKDCTVKISRKEKELLDKQREKELLDKQREKERRRVVMAACQWCGAEFVQNSSGSKKYCCKKCNNAANAAKKRQWRKEARIAAAQAGRCNERVDGGP